VAKTHGEPGAGRLARRVREGALGKQPPETAALRPRVYLTPRREAIFLVAGDKQGNWSGWYKAAIPLAEERYNRWLEGEYDEERT